MFLECKKSGVVSIARLILIIEASIAEYRRGRNTVAVDAGSAS